MKSVVEQPLADIEGADSGPFDRALADEFMHVGAIEWHSEGVAKLDPQVIGVEYRVLRIGTESRRAMLADIKRRHARTCRNFR